MVANRRVPGTLPFLRRIGYRCAFMGNLKLFDVAEIPFKKVTQFQRRRYERRLRHQTVNHRGPNLRHRQQLGVAHQPHIVVIRIRRDIPQPEFIRQPRFLGNYYHALRRIQSVLRRILNRFRQNPVHLRAAEQKGCTGPFLLVNLRPLLPLHDEPLPPAQILFISQSLALMRNRHPYDGVIVNAPRPRLLLPRAVLLPRLEPPAQRAENRQQKHQQDGQPDIHRLANTPSFRRQPDRLPRFPPSGAPTRPRLPLSPSAPATAARWKTAQN